MFTSLYFCMTENYLNNNLLSLIHYKKIQGTDEIGMLKKLTHFSAFQVTFIPLIHSKVNK